MLFRSVNIRTTIIFYLTKGPWRTKQWSKLGRRNRFWVWSGIEDEDFESLDLWEVKGDAQFTS
jgi:hypothetical protein